MSLIEWREEYCTGIKGVDYEHEQLINQINAVHALIEGQVDKALVVDALGEIYGSISAHFALEEQMMRKHGYDQYEQHKSDHESLLDQIRDITDEFENSIRLDDAKFKQKLADWFQRHFSTHDARLHNLTARPHEAVSQSSLKAMIKKAKTRLLQRHGHKYRFLTVVILLLMAPVPVPGSAVQQNSGQENIHGYYSRDGNNASPSRTSGNNIYIKFFEDRWLGMMFVPYPYAINVEPPVIGQVFDNARKKVSSASYMKGKFDLLAESATLQIERYGYLEDRIVFECGSLSPCTIRLGDGFLELIKPGVINEHIIRYNHVSLP